MLPGSLSPSLAEAVARLGVWMPFAQASEALKQLAGADVSEATVRRGTLTAGEALVALEEKAVDLLERELPAAPAGAAWQQVSIDGAMVPLVGGEWAEARTLALGQLRCEQGQLQAAAISYFSRMTDHVSFTRLATLETHRQGLEHALLVLAINDGADWIQLGIDVHCPAAIRILDWAHASEYVHAAGHAVFGDKCGAWCATYLTILREGEPIALLVELARLADTLAEDDPVRETVLTSLAYLAKRYEQIQYATFRARGYPIGSGIVESANKLVVEARLKGAGMHWARTSINPLLALRAAACSGRWDATWTAIAGQRRHAHRVRCAASHARRVARRTPPPPATTPRPRRRRAWGDFRLRGSRPPRHAKL